MIEDLIYLASSMQTNDKVDFINRAFAILMELIKCKFADKIMSMMNKICKGQKNMDQP